jgi:tetratricopeptide (TPR) repeat protein/tRNA A-37 threonylcarbamoyl transferase component Bud32
MTPERWKKVGEIFHAALDQPPHKVKQWAEEACAGDAELRAEVLSLIGSDAVAGEGFLEKKVKPSVISLLGGDAGEPALTRVGPYKLVRELGRGGMGTVYLAERDDEEYRAQVAVKLVRRGFDTDLILSRFYRERQTLATLQHPHIARLLDGGTTPDGSPYIVMEFVDGDRITNWCRAQKLTTEQILKLFLDVASAVSYAHRSLVVHRDIKPGNILVDKSGSVKLLDFGICKLLHVETSETDRTADVGLIVLTPDYASPEQIRGDAITVASDVYSLGAVLYELLTGVKPHKIEDTSLRGMERAVCETEIVRPSVACPDRSIARQLRGDLDNILLTALAKDPRRRYESVDHFADDLRRYLNYEPVKARRDSVWYRTGKFVRRRRGVVLAASVVLVTLLAGVLVSWRSARVANENMKMVRQMANTFLFDVHDSVQNIPGATRARQLIVETGLQYLEGLSQRTGNDPDFQYEVGSAYRRMADVQGGVKGANLGNISGAMTSYGKALRLLEAALQNQPDHRAAVREQILVYRQLGYVHEYRRDPEQSLASFKKAERIAEAYLARNPTHNEVRVQLGILYVAASETLRRVSKWVEASQGYSRAAELLETAYAAEPWNWHIRSTLAAAYDGSGLCIARLGRLPDAVAAYRKATKILEDLAAQDPINLNTQRSLMFEYSHLGDVLGNPNLPNLGDSAGALEAYRKVMSIAERVYKADPADARAKSDYANALSRMSAVVNPAETSARIEMLEKALVLQTELAAVNPEDASNRVDIATNHYFLGEAYARGGDSAMAARKWREGIRHAESLERLATPVLARANLMMYRKLGEYLAKTGDRSGALDLSERTHARMKGPAIAKFTESSRQVLLANAAISRGYIYAALSRSPQRRATDAGDARRNLEDAIGLFRGISGTPTFTKNMQADLNAAEKELERLR